MQRKERKRNSVVSEISLSLSPSLPASVSFPSTATVEVCHLLLFPDKDGCLPLRHNGNAFTTICLCYSLKARGVLFSSHTNFIKKKKKKSDTTHTHTQTQRVPDYYLPFLLEGYKLRCVRGQDVLMPPRVPVDKVTIQQNKGANSFIRMPSQL